MDISRINGYENILAAYNAMRDNFPNHENKVVIGEYIKKIDKYAEVYVIKDSTDICGFLAIYINDTDTNTAFITLIGIDNQYRKMGLGRRLIDYGVREARKKGMKKLRLEVDKDNVGAISFYKKYGMKITDSENCNSFFMEKEIDNHE